MLAHGYNYSVDWWGLGVLLYVLLTGRQPFSSPKTDDPMVVMRRIVDDNWHIKYPPYLTPAAKVYPLRLTKSYALFSWQQQDFSLKTSHLPDSVVPTSCTVELGSGALPQIRIGSLL